MREPYADDPTTRGIATLTPEEIDVLVDMAVKHNTGVAVHAIGDAAIENVLNASLLWHKFAHDQVKLVAEGTFMLEDDDEEARYPGFDGELHDPFIREESSYLTPTLYQLN